MNNISKIFFIVVAFLGMVSVAEAGCRKAQVCDDYGMNCEVKQVCGSTLDLPSIEVDPLRPLPSTQLKPLPSVELPPLGTSKCEYKQVNGFWQNVCR